MGWGGKEYGPGFESLISKDFSCVKKNPADLTFIFFNIFFLSLRSKFRDATMKWAPSMWI